MTAQPTNPLIGKPRSGKATVDDLHVCANELNANPDVIRQGWHYAVVKNEQDKMCVRRVDQAAAQRPRCTPDQAQEIMRGQNLRYWAA